MVNLDTAVDFSKVLFCAKRPFQISQTFEKLLSGKWFLDIGDKMATLINSVKAFWGAYIETFNI